LTDLFESTDFHIGANGEMIGSRPIVPGELDEYMIEAVQEAAEAAGISIAHLLEQHQEQHQTLTQTPQQQNGEQGEAGEEGQDAEDFEVSETVLLPMPGAIPGVPGSISIQALNQMSLENDSQQPTAATSMLRQTTARFCRSFSRPTTPIEIQVDAQGQLRRIVYRQQRSTSHRRRLLETFRSLSQVGQANGLGGTGVGGGMGGLGVLAAAGLIHHNAGAGGNGGGNHGGGGNGGGDNGAARGGNSNRAAGEVMNVTTFAVELERF
jgi:hypothetical protein